MDAEKPKNLEFFVNVHDAKIIVTSSLVKREKSAILPFVWA
jgi:hypothetical protein